MPKNWKFAGILLCFSPVLSAQVNLLSYRPIAQAYSGSLDRIIMISASPDQLHIYDPVSQGDAVVALPKTAVSLSVSADGNYAAVGHDSLISYISLAGASLVKTIPVSGIVRNLVLGANYAYAFMQAGSGFTSQPLGVNLASGTTVNGTGFSYFGTYGILNAAGTALYVSSDGSSPNDMQRVDVSAGAPGKATSWPYHGDYPDCSPYWLSADGSRIYTGCGTVAHSSSDPTLDMYYAQSLPVASIPLVGLAESVPLKTIAVILSPTSYPYPSPNIDSQVQLFSSDFLNPSGTLNLLPFVTPTGSFTAHGKAVFYSSDSSRLLVLAQADSTSNLQNNFGVETISLANPAPCAPAFKSATASVPSTGSLGSVAITATPDCIYTAVSNVSWIQLTTGSYGSGNGTLNWIARPNASAQPRTGTISLGSQTFTISQDGMPATPPALAGLSFNVTDADYSQALDKIVMVAANPNELHIYDPVTQADTIVPLVMPPFAVSVEPGGLHAAVGHDGQISLVDLQAGAVISVFPIVTDVHHVLLAGNGFIYAFPQRAWSDLYSLALVNGAVTGTSAIYNGRIPRLKPNDHYFYLGDNSWASKWDISQGVAKLASNVPGNGPLCGNYWLYQDGSELISTCAKTYLSSDVANQDLQYSGTYSNAVRLTWAANSTALQSTAVIPAAGFTSTSSVPPPDAQIQFYSDAYLGYAGALSIPQFTVGGSTYAAHGQFAFWNSASTGLFTIVSADATAKLASPSAVFTVNLSPQGASCSITLGAPAATMAAAGGFGQALVTSASNCLWTASSDSAWLTITAGAVGAGSATLSWSATANPAATNRIANVTVGGQTFPVMQLGVGVVPLTVTPSALTFSSAYGAADPPAAQTVAVSAASPTFTVSSNSSWLGVSPASGSLPATLTVSVNLSGLAVGTYVGSVIVTAADQQVQTIPVTFTIAPQLSVSPASLSFQFVPGVPTPTVALTISNGSNSSFTLTRSTYWLNSSSSSGTLPATVQISINGGSLTAGTYPASIQISAAGQSITVPVTLTVTVPAVTVTAIGSAANFTAGPVAPGEIVVIGGSALGPAQLTSFTLSPFGAIPALLAGTQVYFDTHPAPIIYTSATAVAAIVPYEIAGQTTTNVQVVYGGTKSPAFPQAVAPTAPALFTTTYSVNGQLVALNSDYSQNLPANPVARGSVIILWGTGEGVTSPPGVDGLLVGSRLTQPLANVTATIGGQPADVIYAGGSPGSVEGLLQINVRVPANITPGSQVPVSIQIGSASSPSGGTIAVQ